MKKFFWAGTIAIVLFGLLVVLSVGQRPAVTIVGNYDGNDWLKWSAEAREFYIGGYLHGYHEGFVEACGSAVEVSTPPQVSNCLNARSKYSRPPKTIAQQVTDFYKEYPEQRDLNIISIFDQFSDQKARSLKEIHDLLRDKKPL